MYYDIRVEGGLTIGGLRGVLGIFSVTALLSISCASVGCGSIAGSGGPPGEASIAGSVVDDATGSPVPGAMIALEQADQNAIDRVIALTTSSAEGTFSFAGLSQGPYDIVADATVSSSGSMVTYAPTVTFGVPLNSSVDRIPLEPEYGNSSATGSPAQVSATVVSAGALGIPVPVTINLSALQLGPLGHPARQVTVPLLAGSTPTVTTVANVSCESGTACANYSLMIPAGYLSFGTFSPSGNPYTIASQEPAEVMVTFEGKAFSHENENVADCTPATKTALPVILRGTLPTLIPIYLYGMLLRIGSRH